jgi:hypothetical protein
MIETTRGRPAATRRRYGKDGTGRQVYQALVEIIDGADHVIGVGELFTITTRTSGVTGRVQSNVPLCGDCRKVVLR